MILPLDIINRGKTLPRSIDQFIGWRAQELARYFDRIIQCRVSLDYRGNRIKPLSVSIEITVPGRSLVIESEPTGTVHHIISTAFATAQRQLRHYALHSRDLIQDTLQDLGPAIISFLNPELGYGHIRTASGRELFFDRKSVLQNGFAHLCPGMKVRFIENQHAPSPTARMLTPL